MAIDYDFDRQLGMSHGVAASEGVGAILLAHIPAAIEVKAAPVADDRNGIDWWVILENGKRIGVDCKIREEDYAAKGQDDLALETWSVVESQVVGWTRNPDKRTDYILWFWKDTRRWCLIPFPMLCHVFQNSWQQWRQVFQHCQQHTPRATGGYHSEVIYVPRREVWAAIYKQYAGSPPGASATCSR